MLCYAHRGCLQAQRVKAQRDMEEVQGVTFHPEISRHAQTIWGPHEVGSVPVWQRLSKGQHEGLLGCVSCKAQTEAGFNNRTTHCGVVSISAHSIRRLRMHVPAHGPISGP